MYFTLFCKEEFCISQRQATIKLFGKHDKDKRLIQNWIPISLLNVDVKVISKALWKHLKNVLPLRISENQSAYVDGAFVNEGGHFIADFLQITDKLKLNTMLVAVDSKKAFDSVNPILVRFLVGRSMVEGRGYPPIRCSTSSRAWGKSLDMIIN